MKKTVLALIITIIGFSGFSQDDCFTRLQKAFDERGANSVANDMHRNVIISYLEEGGKSYCVSGKARVEGGVIVSIFLQYADEEYEIMEKTIIQ